MRRHWNTQKKGSSGCRLHHYTELATQSKQTDNINKCSTTNKTISGEAADARRQWNRQHEDKHFIASIASGPVSVTALPWETQSPVNNGAASVTDCDVTSASGSCNDAATDVTADASCDRYRKCGKRRLADQNTSVKRQHSRFTAVITGHHFTPDLSRFQFRLRHLSATVTANAAAAAAHLIVHLHFGYNHHTNFHAIFLRRNKPSSREHSCFELHNWQK